MSATTFNEWRELAVELAQKRHHLQFAIGDLLIEGEANEKKWNRDIYKEAAQIFPDYKKATLQTFASVSRKVGSLSRNKDLPWAHHKAVMTAKPEKQRELLRQAAEPKMSLAAFKALVHKELATNDPTAEAQTEAQEPKPATFELTLNLPMKIKEDLDVLTSHWGGFPQDTALHLLEVAIHDLPDVSTTLESLKGLNLEETAA